MRAMSAGEQSVLEAPTYRNWLRVWFENPWGVFIDMTAFNGIDWLNGASIDHALDLPVPECALRFRRDHGSLSLAPLNESSTLNRDNLAQYAPFLEPGREFYVQAAVTDGSTPGAGDWKEMFRGETDTVDSASSEIVVRGRDKIGARLVDAFMETVSDYGSALGTPIETVMQNIIDDHATGAASIWLPQGSPGFLITTSPMGRTTVWDALDSLRLLIGWDLRPMWDDGSSTFRLAFQPPNRAAATPDYTYRPTEYIAVTEMAVDRSRVRNRVIVNYIDSGTGTDASETYNNAASQSAYGLRTLVFDEGSGSPIDTQAEALQLATAAGEDLSFPDATHAIEIPTCFWPAEIGDYAGFQANAVHYTTEQRYGITGVRFDWQPEGKVRTLIRARGKPAAGNDVWKKIRPDEDDADVVPVLTVTTDKDAELEATVLMPKPWKSIRIESSLAAFPDDATTEASTNIVDLPAGAYHITAEDIETALGGPLQTLTAGNPTGYVSIIPYKGAGATGERGPLLRDKSDIASIPDGSIDANKIAVAAILDYHIAQGAVTAQALTRDSQSWSTNIEIEGNADDQVSWHGPGGLGQPGVLKFADGTSYTITAVSNFVLTIATPYFIYFDPAVSTTALQITDDYQLASGAGKRMLAWVQKGNASNNPATVVPAIGMLGLQIGNQNIALNSIEAAQIKASTITGNKIAANTITSGLIAAAQINALHIAAGAITTTALGAEVVLAGNIAAGTITADRMAVGALSASNIEAGTISASIVINATSFTGGTATFDGSMNIRAGGGFNIVQVDSNGLHLRNSSGGSRTSILGGGVAGSGTVINSAAATAINGGDVQISGGTLQLVTASVLSGRTALDSYVAVKIGAGGTTRYVRLYS